MVDASRKMLQKRHSSRFFKHPILCYQLPGFVAGGWASDCLMSLSSTSKFDVSVGELTSGIYGAV